MTQEERRRYLLKYLLSEQEQYREMELPDSPEEQWKLFRALCNVRPPEPVSDEFLAIQDAFLQEESRRRGSWLWRISLRQIPLLRLTGSIFGVGTLLRYSVGLLSMQPTVPFSGASLRSTDALITPSTPMRVSNSA